MRAGVFAFVFVIEIGSSEGDGIALEDWWGGNANCGVYYKVSAEEESELGSDGGNAGHAFCE